MAEDLVKRLIDAGIHFGHRASRWNPKMKPYIYGRRNLIHIINVKETLRGILAGRKFLSKVVAEGKDVLFVGTKRQARKSVEDAAVRLNMHWVSDRWIGGALTNFQEIRKRVSRLDELEKLEADGLLDQYSKKQGATLRREMRKIRRNLGGIRKMLRPPGAMVVVDQRREITAVTEARKTHVPVICLLDTDSDPDLVDIPIPGNDDAMRAIELVVSSLCEGAMEGLQGRKDVAEVEADPSAAPRRGRRTAPGRPQEVAGAPPAKAAEAPPAKAAEAPPAEPAPPAPGATA